MAENSMKKCLGIGCHVKEQCKRYSTDYSYRNKQDFVDFEHRIGFDGVCYSFCSNIDDNITSTYVR